jgi:speckle-type POZ protein
MILILTVYFRFFRKLLAAADKYNIVDLKDACEKSLCSSMTVETVSSLLLFAQDRRVAELKAKAIEFISRNIQAVTDSEGWQALVSVPALMTEVVRAMGPRS